jgi:hypothetical protein
MEWFSALEVARGKKSSKDQPQVPSHIKRKTKTKKDFKKIFKE